LFYKPYHLSDFCTISHRQEDDTIKNILNVVKNAEN